MTTFFSRVRSKIAKNDKNLAKDSASVSTTTNLDSKDNCGILVVKLVKSKHDKGLGLTVSGGVDRGSQYPVISHIRLGGISDRSESLVVGDIILAVNKKKTDNLTHQEVVDLLRNAGQHVHLRIQYKIPTPDPNVYSSCKTAVIQLKKEVDGFGIVARESPQTSIHGYRPLVVACVRPGSASQSRGVIHVGDRLLAINGQALLGLSRDDAVLLLKHAHDQVSLQIEYDVLHKEPISSSRGTYIIEVEKPAPTVSLGLILEDRSGVIVISDINEGGVADRLGVFHKDDQIISLNGTFVKEMSLTQVVELLAKSGSRLKIEFLSVHVVNNADEALEPDRYGKVDTWVCSQGEFSDDQLSESTAHDETAMKERPGTRNDDDARQRLRRELPRTPSSNIAGYDNTTGAFMSDVNPYQEIADLIGQTRDHVDLNSEPESKQHANSKTTEGLYAKVRKQRSNSVGPSISQTGRTSPWYGHRCMLGSRRSSFSNSQSPGRGRRQVAPRNNGFWSSGSLQSVGNSQMCRLEYVEVNLTADNQGFGLTIAESFVGRHSILVIAEIECGGPAERSGVLEVNDEVLGINDTDVAMMTAEQCNGMLQSFGTHANILVGFTVAESIVATSGTFSVKLPKHYFGLGITFSDIARENDEKPCIIISHVRKGSMGYRTGMLHLGDKLIALNGRKMSNVEDAIALIDAIPMGEIVSVTVHKEEEIEDESSAVVYTVELTKQGQSTFGIVLADAEESGHNIEVASLVPETIAERSGAVHVGDRILAINDVLVKGKTVKSVYQMLDFSGELVKLRLRSINDKRSQSSNEKDPGSLEIPDMSSLHRVSAWAEIFDELDQIVASSKVAGAQKGHGNENEAAKDDGNSVKVSKGMEDVVDEKSGKENEMAESEITATVCKQVESENGDFWEHFDALWEEHMSSAGSEKADDDSRSECVKNLAQNTESECHTHSASTDDKSETDHILHRAAITLQRSRTTDTGAKFAGNDSRSGTIKGKCISVRYVVREKCMTPAQNSRENTLERSSSVASGYETDSVNDVRQCGRMSRTESEPFASVDSFDISNDADDKLCMGDKKSPQSPSTDILQTRTFSVRKSGEDGFGFSLMPDKFKQEVYIASVLPGGPCDGMLQPLDKITKIDDRDLTQLNIYEIIQILHHGPSTIKVSIVRNPFNTFIECAT